MITAELAVVVLNGRERIKYLMFDVQVVVCYHHVISSAILACLTLYFKIRAISPFRNNELIRFSDFLTRDELSIFK